ncbi:hypothetical protein [Pseudobutyrivibrio sp.]|uniref:hypothetical protein n=1 Tax=Pseudobutyrivibrio sp. TaxID=2014367 RepID=UPI0025DE4DBF|nr:hypothetical protein [Pseudobutyrivibrio sp.]
MRYLEDPIRVELIAETQDDYKDIKKTIYELNKQIDMLSPKADNLDYFVAVASGMLCGMIDILWVGDFDIVRGRDIASDEIEKFVNKTAGLLGCKDDDIAKSVKFLEKFGIPGDGNTPDFGGGLQHHLRDFGHHPTVVGLFFSLLTQFTEMSYGTDTFGKFIVVPVPEKSKVFIGKNIADKLFRGTIIWFFHLVSDMAGSSSTAGKGGGTGIPGPILSLAKEISAIPGMNKTIGDEQTLSTFLSKAFNGTLFAQHDEVGKIIKGSEIKMDFRGELGLLEELGRQAIPVIANECIVRAFYFIRRLAIEIKEKKISKIDDFSKLDWEAIKPYGNPTITRMLTIATGVFTAIDVTEAVATQKYFISINYIGIGRFTVALGAEAINLLKVRNIKKIKNMYEEIDRFIYENNVYERIGKAMNYDKFGLTLEQTEILYNIELQKTLHDIECTTIPVKGDKVVGLKNEWINEWKEFMELGFPGFVGDESAVLHWYEKDELMALIKKNEPKGTWYRLVLLEAMLFEPYYVLSLEKNKKGEDVPSKKYNDLNNPINGFKKGEGDKFIEENYSCAYYQAGYIKRIRKTYDKVIIELNEVLKTALQSLGIAAAIAFAAVLAAGMFAPAIAVALVGSNFAGLNGAALTSACLAYIGGGAVAAGGLGMAGGTMAIVGGSAILGAGVGAGVGGTFGARGLLTEKTAILESAKLMTAVREIFLNDEHDMEYSTAVLEQYVSRIADMEKELVDLRLKEELVDKEEKKNIKRQIKEIEDPVHAMKIAMKGMNKFNSSFEAGLLLETK